MKTRALTTTLALAVCISLTGCSAEQEEGSDGSSAFEEQANSKAAADAADALRARLADPDQLTTGAPIASAEGFDFYAIPSTKASQAGGADADEPLRELIAMKPSGEIVYANLETGGVAGVAPGADVRAELAPSALGLRPRSVTTKITEAVIEDILVVLRRHGVAFGEAKVGALTAAPDANGIVETATSATEKLRGASAKIYAAGASKLKGDPTTLRGLTSALVDKLETDVPGTIAIGATEGERLAGHSSTVFVHHVAPELEDATRRVLADATGVRLAIDGQRTVDIAGARRVTFTDPQTYRGGLHDACDDAVVGLSAYENTYLAQTLADHIVVADTFTGFSGRSAVESYVSATLQAIRRRLARGWTGTVTLTFVATDGTLPNVEAMAREALEPFFYTAEGRHLRLELRS